MCGRFMLFTDFEQLIERFDVNAAFDEEFYSPNYNVTPSHSVVSIINDGKSNRMEKLKWGLIPGWQRKKR